MKGLRKFIVMLIIITITVTFRLTDLINGTEMVDLLKTTGAAFFASNLGEHIVKVIKDKVKKEK